MRGLLPGALLVAVIATAACCLVIPVEEFVGKTTPASTAWVSTHALCIELIPWPVLHQEGAPIYRARWIALLLRLLSLAAITGVLLYAEQRRTSVSGAVSGQGPLGGPEVAG